MEVEYYRFANKKLRAKAIRAYMERYGYEKAVCFSCGNASRELKNAGIKTLDISETGDLQALRWFTIGEIKNAFPGYFDATSGHLPMECMLYVAEEYKKYLHELPSEIYLPTGSGETLVCLKLAFPGVKINAVYNQSPATKYEKEAPLNRLVAVLANKIIMTEDNDV